MFGRAKPQQSDGQPHGTSSSRETDRITSYPQGQEGKAPVVGEPRYTSYRSSIQYDDRGYVTIN